MMHISANSQVSSDRLLKPEDFNTVLNQQQVGLFTLKNKSGCVAQITNYGARLVALWVPDKYGIYKDVVLGFSSIADYLEAKENYHGATIGRCANRIEGGQFELDGTQYNLAINNGKNHLHGGNVGFESVVWEPMQLNCQTIQLSYYSRHVEEGYPGNLSVKVTYTLTDQDELSIQYHATTDQSTVINLTHHSYFNLKGEGEETINDHLLYINANKYTPLRNGSIPTGEISTLDNTPLDFRNAIPIDDRIDDDFDQLTIASGYDHNYVLNSQGHIPCAARVKELNSALIMEVYTDEPGIQLYTGNFLDGSDVGKSGKPYLRRCAFCLETQHFPNSPNQNGFPSVELRPGQQYDSVTTYKFLTE